MTQAPSRMIASGASSPASSPANSGWEPQRGLTECGPSPLDKYNLNPGNINPIRQTVFRPIRCAAFWWSPIKFGAAPAVQFPNACGISKRRRSRVRPIHRSQRLARCERHRRGKPSRTVGKIPRPEPIQIRRSVSSEACCCCTWIRRIHRKKYDEADGLSSSERCLIT